MRKALFLFLFLGLIFGPFAGRTVKAASLTDLADLDPGDLIRGESFSAVYYYGKDGFRYVFPNSKTYFTWYDDFDSVKWISDTDLSRIQIGGNVTYKPGVKMIKINTDPKVYAIAPGGELWWVSTEEAAIALYGSNWNTMIDDVPDGFFSNYTKTDNEIEDLDDFDPEEVEDSVDAISDDKSLLNAVDVEITDDAYGETSILLEVGQTVRFTNNGDDKHTATADDEDWGSGTISPDGGFWVRRFKEAGVYSFYCKYHPSMSGTIIVE